MAYSQYFLILLVSNSIVSLIAQEYISKPQRGEQLSAALTRPFELRCMYKGVGDGEFVEWFKRIGTDDVSVNVDKPGHYVVKQNEHESNLTIKIFVEADAEVTKWYVKTKRNPSVCEFGQISAIPSPQGMEGDRGEKLEAVHGSIRRSEDQLLELKCLIKPYSERDANRVLWEFSQDDKAFGGLPDGITKTGASIKIDPVKKFHRGYYRCKLNNYSFTVLLRVKDRLAALWPFIGIVSIVLVLVIIILIFEKRQKTNKKSSPTDDDDQDRASDPLVRTTIKTSDNDNKKRAVKA